jgi:pimeloyl-ACP methyl ester carboxylesterase
MSPQSKKPDEKKPLVVLIHGLAAGPLSMSVIGRMLQTRGFRVVYWGYPSLFQPIENHAIRLREYLTESLADEPKIHIVAHSMGPIVVRGALAYGPIPNLGRLAFLAPPNQGLPKARFAEKFLGRLLRPLADLSSRPDSYVCSLPPASNVEIGIIAAKYDLLIPVRRTHLEGENYHEVIHSCHISILFSRRAANLIASHLNDNIA